MPCKTTLGKSRKTLTAKPLKSTQTSFPSTTRLLRSFLTISPLSRPSMSCPSSQKSGSQGCSDLRQFRGIQGRAEKEKAQKRAERKVAVVAQQPAKRRPGRPRKQQPPPVPVVPIAPLPSVQNKKKRGRPKGSRNKKTLAAFAKASLELKQNIAFSTKWFSSNKLFRCGLFNWN